MAWQSNNTRPGFIHAVALLRTVWRRVIYPRRVRYAALHAVVAVGLVGHTCAELSYASFGCDRPHGALAPLHGMPEARVLALKGQSDHTFTSTHTLWLPPKRQIYTCLRALPSLILRNFF